MDEICPLLEYYGALSGISTDFSGQAIGPIKKSKQTLEDGTDNLSRNVGTELSLVAA